MKGAVIKNDAAEPGFPMVQVSNFGGKRICAVKTDVAFEDAQDVDENGLCNSDYKMCPENNPTAVNKICLPKNKLGGGACPVMAL